MEEGKQVNASLLPVLPLALAIAFAVAGCKHAPMAGHAPERNDGGAACISVADLGDAVSKKPATYCGYFLDRYPFFMLYDSYESYSTKDFRRAVTVRYDSCLVASGAEGIESLNGSYVYVTGVFDPSVDDMWGHTKGQIDSMSDLHSPTVRVVCSADEMRMEAIQESPPSRE